MSGQEYVVPLLLRKVTHMLALITLGVLLGLVFGTIYLVLHHLIHGTW